MQGHRHFCRSEDAESEGQSPGRVAGAPVPGGKTIHSESVKNRVRGEKGEGKGSLRGQPVGKRGELPVFVGFSRFPPFPEGVPLSSGRKEIKLKSSKQRTSTFKTPHRSPSAGACINNKFTFQYYQNAVSPESQGKRHFTLDFKTWAEPRPAASELPDILRSDVSRSSQRVLSPGSVRDSRHSLVGLSAALAACDRRDLAYESSGVHALCYRAL